MSRFSWRVADLQDAERIVSLVNGAYRGASGLRGWTTEAHIIGGQRTDREGIEASIGEADHVILIATASDTPEKFLGCVDVRKSSATDAYFGMLSVDPDAQGSGVGDFLIKCAERYAQERFLSRRMTMSVITIRTELIAYYERRGYHATGVIQPFPYGQERFGLPLRDDLEMMVFAKDLTIDLAKLDATSRSSSS